MAYVSKCIWTAVFAGLLLALGPLSPQAGEQVTVGTWETAQTIQPFFYNQFLPDTLKSRVFAFTNPADRKTALLAGSLTMCGTTLAYAIYSAAMGTARSGGGKGRADPDRGGSERQDHRRHFGAHFFFRQLLRKG